MVSSWYCGSWLLRALEDTGQQSTANMQVHFTICMLTKCSQWLASVLEKFQGFCLQLFQLVVDSKGHSLSDTRGEIVLKRGSHASVWGYNLQLPVRKIADPVTNYFSSQITYGPQMMSRLPPWCTPFLCIPASPGCGSIPCIPVKERKNNANDLLLKNNALKAHQSPEREKRLIGESQNPRPLGLGVSLTE